MISKIKKLSPILAIVLLFSITIGITSVAFAAPDACTGSDAYVCTSTADDLTKNVLTNVVNTMLFAAGIIAVIMIIIGGIRYITSDGDASKASQAKNTIIYAVIGIAVSVMSYGIVNFVIGRL